MACPDRTIRRDLDALAQAGFPIDTTKRDGKTVYTLNREVFRGVAAAGFSLSELCALHLSRTVLTAVAGGPFRDSLASAFDKLYDALPPSMWKFIESLPDALGAKEHASRPRGGVLGEGHRHADVGDPLPPPRPHALSLVLQPAGQGLHRRTLSAGLRARRAVSAGVRARLQRHADVRHPAHRTGRGARGDLQPGRERARTCFPIRSARFQARPKPW